MIFDKCVLIFLACSISGATSTCEKDLKRNLEVKTKKATCDTTALDAKCTAQCRPGYINSNDNQLTTLKFRCMANSSWQPFNGETCRLRDSQGNHVNAPASTPILTSSTKKSLPTTTATATTTVSPTPPTCTAVPHKLELNNIATPSGKCPSAIGETCELTCKNAYRINEAGKTTQNITCKSNGIWSPPKTCTKIVCPTGMFVTSASSELRKPSKITACDVSIKSFCTIACPEGYVFSDDKQKSQTLQCEESGVWSKIPREIGSCEKKKCSDPRFGRRRNEMLRNCNDKSYQSTCTIGECLKGYEFANGATQRNIRCKADGSWSETVQNIGNCKPMKCKILTFRENNMILPQNCNRELNQQCDVKCPAGYKLKGTYAEQRITCIATTSSVAWTPNFKNRQPCEEIMCSNPKLGTAEQRKKLPDFGNSCKKRINEQCVFKCPEGYEFPDKFPQKSSTCKLGDEIGYWYLPPNSIPRCEPKLFQHNSCEYWFSDTTVDSQSSGQERCKEMLGNYSVLAMPKTSDLQSFMRHDIFRVYGVQGSSESFFIGADVKGNKISWKDGDKSGYAGNSPVACVTFRNNKLLPTACDTERKFICEKPVREYVDNRCTVNSCKSGGTCIPYGCGFSCECQSNFYGYQCEEGPVQIEITSEKLDNGRTVNIRYTAKNNAGRARFELRVNGRLVKNITVIAKRTESGMYTEREVKRDLYVSGTAILDAQRDAAIMDCHRVKTSGQESPVNIKKDKCNGTVLKVSWEPFTRLSGFPIEYWIYVNDKKFGAVQTKNRSTVTGLRPDTKYKIKVVPILSGCENLTLFEEYEGKTSKGPRGPSNVTISIQNSRPYSNCIIKWKNNRLTNIGGYKVKITEKNRNNDNDEVVTESERNSTILRLVHRTKPNSFYQVRVGTKASNDCKNVPVIWSDSVAGCHTESTSPENIPVPATVVKSSGGNAVSIPISPVDERNGQVSCYIVVIQKINGSATDNNTVTDVSKLKQRNETVKNGDRFIAAAFARFTGDKTLTLGNDEVTCCDMSNSSKDCGKKTSRRKRAAEKQSTVNGYNREPDVDAKYRHYIIVSTPQSNGEPLVAASPLSEIWSPGDGNVAENIGVKVAVPIVIILIFLILLIGLFLYRRKRATSKAVAAERVGINNRVRVEDPVVINLDNRDPCTVIERALARHSFQLADLFQTMNDKRADEDMLFLDEFKTDIPRALQQCRLSFDMSGLPANRQKNRYKNIVPYDNSRVVLTKIPGDEFSDYVNAAYIDGHNYPKKFIATQGPIPETIPDFWRMIWDQRSCVIAMLTRLTEKKKVKCAQYWPEDEGTSSKYGRIKVSFAEYTSFGDFVRRKFEVSRGDEIRNVFQFQFIAWPDHGIPDTTSSIFRFHKSVLCAQQPAAGAIVVHCSAGVGRTGTFLALDILSEQIMETEEINICLVVGKMRTKRPEMVQTLEQYIYIHKLVLELYQFAETDVDVGEFNAAYGNLERGNVQQSEIDQEFTMLDYFLPLETDQESGQKQTNNHLNRDSTVLPYDHNVAFIQMNPNDKCVPYYNASVIASYHTTDRFIAAQTPERDSMEMFWRMVMDNNVSMIVALCEKNEDADFCYWPAKSEFAKYGVLTVKTLKETSDMGCVEREFEVSSKDKKITVNQIFYEQWAENAVPSSSGIVLEIIAKIEKHHQTLTNCKNKTTLVHCSDGAGRTGTFCAISNSIERLKNENRVDIFRTAKDLRDQRPMMVRTPEEYKFCYQAVSDFLKSFDLYGNFQ